MRLKTVAIWLCLLLTTIACVPSVGADALVSTPTQILGTAPLIITSFKTTGGGKDISFLEVYNNGNTLQKLSDWMIVDTTNQRSLMAVERSGYIEPNTHVVLARDGAVLGATYTITGWSTSVLNPQIMTNLELVNVNYRPTDMVIASKYIDVWTMRSYLTASYSSTTLEPAYRALFDDGIYVVSGAPIGLQVVEIYPYASSCDPFDGSVLCGDYIKLFNASDHAIDLSGYVIRTDSSSSTRTNTNAINLGGELRAGEYRTVALTNSGGKLALTNSGGYVWLEDTWGLSVYNGTLTRYEPAGSALQGYAYAAGSNGAWQWTTTPMPLGENVITPLTIQTCADGKYLNPDTNRCRTLEETLNTLTTCEEGSERNLATNRCRKIVSSSASTLTPCKEDQVRSPETNRCRSIAGEASSLTPCAVGSERNPETNRCRKVAVAGASTSKYPVEPYGQSSGDSTVWWAVGGAAVIAVGYGVWEWRQEIMTVGSKLRALVTRRKN